MVHWLISILECIHHETKIPQDLRILTKNLFLSEIPDEVIVPLDEFILRLNDTRNCDGLQLAFTSFQEALGGTGLSKA